MDSLFTGWANSGMEAMVMGTIKYIVFIFIRVQYGERFKNKGVLGVLLDMNKGILAFGLYKLF
jgi:hypothetical protein